MLKKPTEQEIKDFELQYPRDLYGYNTNSYMGMMYPSLKSINTVDDGNLKELRNKYPQYMKKQVILNLKKFKELCSNFSDEDLRKMIEQTKKSLMWEAEYITFEDDNVQQEVLDFTLKAIANNGLTPLKIK